MPLRTVTPDNAPRLARLRQFGTKPSLVGFRGQHLDFDARGHHLVSVGRGLSGALQWWDFREGDPRPAGARPLERGWAAGLLPAGDTLVSITVRGVLQAWRVADGALQHEAPLDLFLLGLGIASQGEHLLLASHEGRALLWDARHWRLQRELEPTFTPLRCCALSPDGRLAVAGTDATRGASSSVRFWDVSSGAALGSLSLESAPLQAVAFEPSGRLLAAGTSLGNVHLIDVASRTVLRTYRGPAPGVHDLSFSPDGALLAVAGAMAGFIVMHTGDGRWLYDHGDDNDLQASSARFSPDGRFIAWGQGDGTVGLWGVEE